MSVGWAFSDMATTTQAPKDPADDKRVSGGAGAASAASSSSSLFTVGRWLAVVAVAFAAGVATGGSSPSAVVQDAIAQWQSLSSRTLVALFNSPTTITDDTPVSVDCQDAHQYLTDVMPVKGFHVLCIETTTNDTLMVTAFKDGMHPNASTEVAADAQAFKLTVEQQLLGMESEPASELAAKYKQPAAYFTPDGVRLDNFRSLRNRIVFLFEGGQFIWPGVKIGHKTLIRDVFGRGDVELETLSMTPLVFGVEEFLRDDEIDIILELSLDHLAPSGVSLLDGHENRPATDWRTSSTYWLPSSRHRVVQNIDRRTADLTKIPISHQEDVQVLRYEKTQKYDQHLDYFDATKHRNSPSVLKSIEFGFKNRMVTVFWYMSDVARGGHTNFPRAGGLAPPHTNVGCFQGLKVAPKKRKVVVFYSMLPNGEGDPMSLHGGCPVEEGVKFSGNKWVWNKPRAG